MERYNLFSMIFSLFVSRNNDCDYITNLPTKILLEIFQHLSSNQVASCRQVCQKFNLLGQRILNRRFYYFCRAVPKALRAVAYANRPDEIEKLRELHLINSGIMLLRAVFGQYMVSGRCCFYPGTILDTLDILLKEAQKSCHCHLLTIRYVKFTKYSRSLRKCLHLIEVASDHFENQIEPFLAPPMVFSERKTIDLIKAYCDVQSERNTEAYNDRIASIFPSKYPVNSFKKFRKEILYTNLKWVEANVRRPTIQECGINSISEEMNESVPSCSRTFNQTLDVVKEGGEDLLEFSENRPTENESVNETETTPDANDPSNSYSADQHVVSITPMDVVPVSSNEQSHQIQTENVITENLPSSEELEDVEMTSNNGTNSKNS